MRPPGRRLLTVFVTVSASALVLRSGAADRAGLKTLRLARSNAAAPRSGSEPAGPAPTNRVAATRALERMPLYFIENRGQLDSRVAYYVQGRDTTLYFTAEGMTLVPDRAEARRRRPKGRLEKASLGRNRQVPERVTREPLGREARLRRGQPEGRRSWRGEPTPAVVSYFKGRREDWKAGLSTYGIDHLRRSLAGD